MLRLTDFYNYLHVVSKFTHPGFSRVLGVDAATLLKESQNSSKSLEVCGKNELKYRYVIPQHACSKFFDDTLPLSAILALFDEVTTWAIVCTDRGRRPGVSTWLYAERASNDIQDKSPIPGNTIDIIARVTKVGKIFGFTEAEAIDVNTGQVIVTGRHVKYLPGSYLQSIILGPLLPLAKLYVDTIENTHYDSAPSMDTLLKMRNMSQDYKIGNLRLGNYHNNPNGSFHGGSQAVTMEIMGNKYASHSSGGKKLRTQSIGISYMSPGSGDVSVISNTGNIYGNCMSVNVKINNSKGKSVSEGILTYEAIPVANS